MADPARNDWIGTREDRWTDVLPQSWQSAINTNPVVNALARYMQPRQSFDQYAREWQDNIPGNSPIDRIAEGRSTIAKEYPSPMNPLAADMLEKGGFLANFLAPGGVRLPGRPQMMRAPETGGGGGPTQPGIKAYHGSPHDFDKFDISKIGTGEGAQAYGRGLYFAESEGVAKEYRNRLSGRVANTVDDLFAPDSLAGKFMAQADGDAQKALALITGEIDKTKAMPAFSNPANPRNMEYGRNLVKGLEEAARAISAGNTKVPGRMYEVRINADPERFLDWDKPLSQQPEAVKKAYADALKSLGHHDPSKIEGSAFASSGEGLENLVNTWARYDRAKASQTLRDAGIPGIKYKDAMSRDGGGPGTSNYVVFDAALIEILRKYGLLPPVAAGAAQAATQGQDQQF